MDSKISELPNSWVIVKLGDFVENEKGKKPKNESKVETASHSIPYVDIQAFEENVICTWTDGVGCRLCYETDFLMVWDGSRSGLVGKGMNGALGSTLVRIYFPSMVNDYAFYFLQSKYQQINTRAKGVGIPHVDPALLWNYGFPIAPLNEQHRIVAKIEELFSELDKGIENLKTARAQLKVYRQALLKHAFEGKLTAQWRAENQGKLETAAALLKRIQQERAQRYQQQLADRENKSPSIPLLQRGKPTSTAPIPPLEKGGDGGISKPKPPKSLPPLTAEELAELPELPEGWAWIKYGELTVGSQNGISKRSGETGRELVVLRLADITDQKISLYNPRKILLTENEINNYRLFKNDLICIRVNGSADLVGRIISIKEDMEAAYCDHFIRYRLLNKIISPIYLQHFFNTLSVRRYVELNKVSSAGQNTVNQEMLGSVLVAICGAEEQEVIVELLDTQFSEADQLDQTITTALQQAEALRQSILKKAFSGQLVPQDTNDEPASELLARIRAEKAAQPNNKKGRL